MNKLQISSECKISQARPMKKHLIIIFAQIFYFVSYSQNSFNEGYYINNEDQKVEGLIQNDDWRYNPTEFNFKLNNNSKIEKKTLNSVKEFGIGIQKKYIRVTVKIDKSSNRIQSLTSERDPVFVEETLFLKVLFEGEANLFEYKDKSITRYFYSTKNQDIEQLVYKKYYVAKNTNSLNRKVDENNFYRTQLWNNLKCEGLALEKVKNLKYTGNDLINYFVLYNQCLDLEYVSYKPKKAKGSFNFSLRPHINYSSLSIGDENNSSIIDVEFDDEVNIGFGFEIEYMLPLYNQNWSIILEPTYQSYASKKQINSNLVSGGILNVEAKYTTINTPLGFRYYLHLDKRSKLFFNTSANFSFYLKSSNNTASVVYRRDDGSIINTIDGESAGFNFGFGGGYKLNNKFSLEIRYLTGQDLYAKFVRNSSYKTVSFIFGYTL